MKDIILAAFFLLVVTVTTASAQNISAKNSYDNGVALARGHAYEDALAKFDAALASAQRKAISNDDFAKIHFNKGVCLYQLHRHTEAATAFGQALTYKPRYEKVYYALGMSQAERGNWRDAEAALRNALKVNPKNGETWFDLAFVYLAQKDFAAARTAFERSTKYKSVDSAIGHNNVGVILAMNGDFAKAEAEFKQAILESGGKLDEARNNLDFCQQRADITKRDVARNLEFGRAIRGIGE